MLTEAIRPDTKNPWAAAWATDRSPVSERLVRALEAHEAAEAESLGSYYQLADGSGDAVVAALVRLVIEDEKRHQQLLLQMTSSPDGIDGSYSSAALLAGPPEDRTAAIVATRALIREEREGARHLRHLARQEHQLHDGIYAILLESMARDSEKHEHILRYVLKRLEGTD